jgi:hypothetical protein
LFWSMLIAIIMLGGHYVWNFHQSPMGGDSQSYIRVSYHIGDLLKGNIDTQRTPVYPVFLALCRSIAGEEYSFRLVAVIQYIFTLISVYYYYHICRFLFRSTLLVFFSCVAYIFIVLLKEDCNASYILTEPLSVFATVFFFYGLISYVKNPVYYKAILLGLGLLVIIMLRPAFSIFLPILLLFWLGQIVFFRISWKKSVAGLLATCLSVLLILGYSHLVWQKSGVFSITHISTFNLFCCVVQSRLYEQSDNREMYEMIQGAIEEFKRQCPEKLDDPYWLSICNSWGRSPLTFVCFKMGDPHFISDSDVTDLTITNVVKKDPHLLDNSDYTKTDLLLQRHCIYLNNYVTQTIKANQWQYLKYVLEKMVAMLQKEPNKWGFFFGSWILSFIVFLCFIRKESLPQSWVHFLCLLFSAGIIVTSFGLAYTDYGRLIYPIISLLILGLFLAADRIFALCCSLLCCQAVDVHHGKE